MVLKYIRLGIISWNVEGIEKHFITLDFLFQRYKPDVVCLQETKCHSIVENEVNLKFNKYTTRINVPDDTREFNHKLKETQVHLQQHGTSLSVHKRFRKTNRFIQTLNNRITSSRLTLQGENILLISAYFPTDGGADCQTDYRNFVEELTSFVLVHNNNNNDHVILTGDYNFRQDKPTTRNKLIVVIEFGNKLWGSTVDLL